MTKQQVTLANGQVVWVCYDGKRPVLNPKYLPPKPTQTTKRNGKALLRAMGLIY